MSLRETGRFETPNGSKYLQQLCKHFAHKITVEYDAENGHAELPPGPAHMTADATGLTIEITAQDKPGLEVARYIIDDHLKRFAFRDNFEAMAWRPS